MVNDDNIGITSPVDDKFNFEFGQKYNLTYTIHNNTDHYLQALKVIVFAQKVKNLRSGLVIRDGEAVECKKKYTRIIKSPSVLLPRQSKEVIVEVSMPDRASYDEKAYDIVFKRDILVPFRVGIFVKGNEVLQEL